VKPSRRREGSNRSIIGHHQQSETKIKQKTKRKNEKERSRGFKTKENIKTTADFLSPI
jgi:hypothetical protein